MSSHSTGSLKSDHNMDPESTPRKLYSVLHARNSSPAIDGTSRQLSNTSAGNGNEQSLDGPQSVTRFAEEALTLLGAPETLNRTIRSNSDIQEDAVGGIGDCDPMTLYGVDMTDFVHTVPHFAFYVVMFALVIWIIR